MPSLIDQRDAIEKGLGLFKNEPLQDAARKLFETLGYKSDRRVPIATPTQFRAQLDPQGKLTAPEIEAIDQLQSLHLLFQLTDTELGVQHGLFVPSNALEQSKIESYLFFAAELPDRQYSRTDLSRIIRAVNKPLPMPAIILLKHGDRLSLGIIHRRLHKRDQARDVLDKVTLVKDIHLAEPIRAHLEILNDFARANLDAEFGVSNFVSLHEAWRKRLDTYELSKGFYREIADWYFWAHHQVDDKTIRLPQHCDTEQERSLFLIRLLTRVIFCWFLVEKRLIPQDLFRDRQLRALLKGFQTSTDSKKLDTAPTYYRAILQNLFFGTLNMPQEQREFRKKAKAGQRYDQNYGVTNLWRYEAYFNNAADWEAVSKKIPFLNGGLFDCLDDKSGKKKDNFILDGFSDREDFGCHLPNDLFFGPERTVDLSRDYGEEDKRTARSKKAKVQGLFAILSRYKFTIEENTPLEEEIALDPELLGKVFENLLASYNEDTRTTARKALGAFYTPREIVSYMVDEALKSYLSTQVPGCKGALEDLFSNKATLKDIKPETKDKLIAAIGRVKILDPACGSGAFPMGALHRLVDLLQKLDPNNESWKRDRLADTRRENERLAAAGATKEQLAEVDARIKDIEESFNSRRHALDFSRKLYLIENCIYGVDIQPIATQIAKLRFFISLIVDQKVDSKAPNLGVRALPNLETRLVAADALIPIDKAETDLFSADLDRLRAELAAIRHEHFNARTPATKRKWRDHDQLKRQEIAALLERQHAIPRESAKKLAAWDPYDQNASAPFFDSEWMFGRTVADDNRPKNAKPDENWFDIVIGNPPYIRIQTLKQKDPTMVAFYKDHYTSASKGNYDLYVVFIEAGWRLLKPDGYLAYICPHKFFNTDYGEPLRGMIARNRSLRHVVHFGTQQVFPGATNYVCLLFLSAAKSDTCRWLVADSLDIWLSNPRAGDLRALKFSDISSTTWNFSDASADALLDHLRRAGTPLLELPADMSRGSSSGDDSVFMVATGSTDIEEGVLRVPVFATDFRRWEFEPNLGMRIIYPYEHSDNGVSLISEKVLRDKYPRCFKYLSSRRTALERRKQFRAWYGYSAPRNLELHDDADIVVPLLAGQPSFAAIPSRFKGKLCLMASGGFSISVGDRAGCSAEYLLGLLNSSILFWVLARLSNTFRGGWITCTKQYFGSLPVVRPSKAQDDVVAKLVKCLTSARTELKASQTPANSRDDLMVAYWEQLLNGLVYELYLTTEVHGAGLRIFDALSPTKLPEVDSVPNDKRLPQLREAFEDTYDSSHPVRVALEKLQTLDSVRIIEGGA